MAKPIRAVRTLSGEDANIFVERMVAVENSKITKEQKKFAKEIEENMKSLLVC